jgi:hypothetical protein
MKKKQIDWETLKYIAIVAQDNECDGCDICRQDTCPLWASLEDAPLTRIVPPDPKRGEVSPQIVTDLSDGKDTENGKEN